MRNFCLTIEYDGTDYNGWQIQDRNQRRRGGRVRTIQGALRDALYKIFSKKVTLISCGRTDSGVHAKSHIANFKISTSMQPLQIKKALNSILPGDIVVKKLEAVKPGFNAQHDALSKTYRYVICNRDYVSPFVRRYAYRFRQPLNARLMRREAKELLGTHDFSAFKTADGNFKQSGCVRTIKKLNIKNKKGFIEIEIEADGFLYNMVRNIVGTLIEIARGKFLPGSMKKILKSRNRKNAGPTVPARGLCLSGVKYRNCFQSEYETVSGGNRKVYP